MSRRKRSRRSRGGERGAAGETRRRRGGRGADGEGRGRIHRKMRRVEGRGGEDNDDGYLSIAPTTNGAAEKVAASEYLDGFLVAVTHGPGSGRVERGGEESRGAVFSLEKPESRRRGDFASVTSVGIGRLKTTEGIGQGVALSHPHPNPSVVGTGTPSAPTSSTGTTWCLDHWHCWSCLQDWASCKQITTSR